MGELLRRWSPPRPRATRCGSSLRTSPSRTLLCLLLGVPMAWCSRAPASAARGSCARWSLLPLVLPPVVGGIALLYTFGRRGLLGERARRARRPDRVLDGGVVLAQTFVALPFLVVSLEGALRSAGAAVRGGRRDARRAPEDGLPPGHLAAGAARAGAGAVLALARALGEFGATITFAGSLQGTTRTLPL